MRCAVVRGARGQQDPVIREVGIHRRSADAGSLSECRHGRGERTHLLVECDGGLNDGLSRGGLTLRATLESIWSAGLRSRRVVRHQLIP